MRYPPSEDTFSEEDIAALTRSRPLARKLTLAILLVSTIVTAALTTLSFYIEYRQEMSLLEQRLQSISHVMMPHLARSVWDSNEDLIRMNGQTLLASDEIVAVQLVDTSGEVLLELNAPDKDQSGFIRQDKFPLELKADPQNTKLVGTAQITISKWPIYSRILRKVLLFLAIQGIKTLLVCAIIFAIIGSLVMRHIEDMARFITAKGESVGSTPWTNFTLRRQTHQPDELDTLAEALNNLGSAQVARHTDNETALSSALEKIDQQETTIRRSERLASIGEVAVSIAHEINNPVAVIASTVRQTERHLRKNDIQDEVIWSALERIQRTTHAIKSIVKGLLSMAREGSQDPKGYFPLHDFMHSVFSVCRHRVQNTGAVLRLETNLPKEHKIFAREAPLAQVLLNLIINALDAIEGLDEKWVTVRVEVRDGIQCIDVVDSGRGVPEDLADRIFEMFYTSKPSGKGTGLGLGICQKIVQDQGGTIRLAQQEKHTTFHIELPLSEAPMQIHQTLSRVAMTPKTAEDTDRMSDRINEECGQGKREAS